jgi:bacteriocin-like protein
LLLFDVQKQRNIMLMKYKDFKTMSNEEMKQVKGGNAPEGGGGTTVQCWVHCSKPKGNGEFETGDCTLSNNTCNCSLTGTTTSCIKDY